MREKNYLLAQELRQTLHKYPELSGQENDTKQRLIEFITSHTPFQVVDQGKWFWVKIPAAPEQNKKPVAVAFRADMDALPITEELDVPYVSTKPGISHKCGHDGHSASLAGLALELADNPPPVEVYLIFQHAEEIGAGGDECSQLLREKQINWVFSFHNWSGIPRHCVALRSDVAQMPSLGITIYLRGITAHASQPEDGINPGRAIAQIISYALNLSSSGSGRAGASGLRLVTLVHSEIASNGKNFGISADKGQVSFTLRADCEANLEELLQTIVGEAKLVAAREKLHYDQEILDRFPETRNHDQALQIAQQAAEKASITVVTLDKPYRASEDFGYYLKEVPGAMLYIGNGENYPHIHTQDFDFIDKNIEVAVDLWVAILTEIAAIPLA